MPHPSSSRRSHHRLHRLGHRRGQSRWRRWGIVAAALLLIVAGAWGLSGRLRNEAAELYYTVYAKLYVDAPLTELATKKANLAYCGTSSRFQKLDLYIPKRPTDMPAPIVVYIHGGGWSVGDKSSNLLAYYGQTLLARGLAVASINYRLAPAATYPKQNQDVACAIRYLRDTAATYGLDGSRLALFGDSAGGQLAAMAAFDPQLMPAVKMVVQFYSPSDLWVQLNHKPKPDRRVYAYLGSWTNQALARQASPLYHVPADPPPFVMFHGTDDQTVSYNQSVLMADALRQAGGRVMLQTVRSANHNFSTASRPNAPAIRDQLAGYLAAQLLMPNSLRSNQ